MADTGAPTGALATSDRDIAVVRSEERLVVGVEVRPSGRVRVSKRIVTEERTVTVQVRREELVVEELPVEGAPGAGHAPVSAAVAGPDGRLLDRSGQVRPLELVLHEERVETITRVVPVERVVVHLERVSTSTDVHADTSHEVVTLE